jgi:hypothetical protein
MCAYVELEISCYSELVYAIQKVIEIASMQLFLLVYFSFTTTCGTFTDGLFTMGFYVRISQSIIMADILNVLQSLVLPL